ncbi:hypothetical protein BJF79_02765 [Actinomadura sp. CNU-125]|uniref:hypothetical protein n=1 Tax=Actinomadura sp. CNU-125 TaxID=1904961 RepID=UPI0009622D00|nr:hypothetical protein [Actinomadura sp. CNU-125]OLT19144.1 hypothetical protein BJF79_02765 [Actinomadura sp. CNU-125]
MPGADVDLIDRLPRTGPGASWPTVAAWLRAGKTAATRRTRLADTAAFGGLLGDSSAAGRAVRSGRNGVPAVRKRSAAPSAAPERAHRCRDPPLSGR